jgi:hypothetical protein
MQPNRHMSLAGEIMRQFAESTGLAGSEKPRRYLWTDAFAVCNFLELYRLTGEELHKTMALRLVEQVHQVLGRHRDDDRRTGWISGLAEAEGSKHPTRGGLLIGKPLQERQPEEPFDEQLEWQRDGQYFHYLTKWMHALHRAAEETDCMSCAEQASELAAAAHAGFTHQLLPGKAKGIHWKMSIDLSRPLVPAMGHHDPLDGYLSYLELQRTPAELAEEIADMEAMCRGGDWTTVDPLGIGGLLSDSLRTMQLTTRGKRIIPGLAAVLLTSAADGLDRFAAHNPLRHPAEYRLAFRELGLAIGLQAVDRMDEYLRLKPKIFGDVPAPLLDRLHGHRPTADLIVDFWPNDENRQNAGWMAHADINMVMLATSIIPDGFFGR